MADQSVTPLQNSNPNFSGQVIFDGTSYSGADIKVVVHVYGDRAKELKIKELESRIESLNADNATETPEQIVINNQKIQALASEAQFIRDNGAQFVTKVLAEAQTLSVSTYREKYPVRAIGSVYPRGVTRGPRSIAGSIVFTVFDKNVLYEILQVDPSEFDSDKLLTSVIIDQLPPLDISIVFANELGQLSRMTIYGVDFISEGQTMSIHDLFIENQVQYIARDIDPMTKEGDLRKKVLTPGTRLASDLLRESSSQDYITENDPFRRFLIRNNPFE